MMNYKDEFELNKIEFSNVGLNKLQSEYFVAEYWPIVYILNSNAIKLAYVGETTDANSRMAAHLKSDVKKHLKEALFISSKKFNKSATLDIESNLIKYLHGDGRFKLLNGNLGIINHAYYQRDQYYTGLFKEIWNALIRKGIAQHSLEHISNSDLFKYSPYKTLSIDQRKNLMLIIDALIADNKKNIFVEGGAGTGKTILAIFLFKLMLTTDDDFNYMEFGEDELDFIDKVYRLKKKFPNPKMGLVIAMSSFRKTIKNVFSGIQGLKQDMVIGPSELGSAKYDILFVDEAHRLRKRVNLTNYASFDNTARKLGFNPKTTNELEWTQKQSNKNLYFYDPKQSIKPTDVDPEHFARIKNSANSKVIQLFSQFRSKGGNGYVKFVDDLLDQNLKGEQFKYSNKNYEVILFENFKEFVACLRDKNTKHGLCRFVAGYGWEWKSKNNKSAFDIVIEGMRFQWNHDNIEFIMKDDKAEQIGCIHTTQGYDLNYVGVIFGPEIKFNTKTNSIEVIKDNYYDANGQNTITDINVLKQYIINIYKTIMLRGILGCYLYVVDPNLRNYFANFMQTYNLNEIKNLENEVNISELIPFVNSVPLYSLRVAAGEFYLNENNPDLEFIYVEDKYRISKDHFACRIIGNSMNKIVKDGEIALFKKYKGGSRDGLLVIVEYYDLQDVDFGSCYTFKEYHSVKSEDFDGRKNEKIILKPKSYDTSYKDIVINAEGVQERKYQVVGVFDCVLR